MESQKADKLEFRAWVKRDRLLSLCRLECDHNLPPDQLVYSLCLKCHMSTFFSTTEKAKHPRDRLCLGREGKVWLYEHGAYIYGDLRSLVDNVESLRSLSKSVELHQE